MSMMVTHNPFKGVNPHLNSKLQTPDRDDAPELWTSFQANFVSFISGALNQRQQLPQNYVSYTEQAIQIADHSFADESEPPYGVVIRQPNKRSLLGKVITRIELLCPSNKPGGVYAAAYQIKRDEALASGVPLIEIDLLHESPTLIPNLPTYPHEPGAHPYTIAISDPRPTWTDGRLKVYGVAVDQPLPKVRIPLADNEALIFDFDAVYQNTFTARRSHFLVKSYDHVPVRFETYSADDQARIHQVMAALAASAESSESIEET
jgi:hypothetical protein